jgi:transcriptional regulator with XRE-family HTH domain
MDFWMRLKNEIKAQNTTQEWVASKIGVPLSTFRKWMTRKTYPDMREGVAIAKLLETSAEYLATGVKIENLSDTEQKLISVYRKLGPADRENVMLAVKAWAGKKSG